MILFPKSFVAQRSSVSNVNGQAVASTPTNVPFIGDIQPMSSRDILALQVGRHDIGKVKVFSNTALMVSASPNSPSPTSYGDKVTYQGNVYEVIQESNFTSGMLDHFEYVAELRRNAT